MSNKSVENKVFDIVSKQLSIEKNKIKKSYSFIKDLKADSLDVVELIMSVEEEWKISIPDEIAEKMETIQDVINYVKQKAKL
ncbi:MAG: acyl carrier protein [Bdellovibrionales bacterium]|nr:acyl carrier protein [Bdellovibrionales bacterium]